MEWWFQAVVLLIIIIIILVSLLKAQCWGLIPKVEKSTWCIVKQDGVKCLTYFSLFGSAGWHSELTVNCSASRTAVCYWVSSLALCEASANNQDTESSEWEQPSGFDLTKPSWELHFCLHTFLLWRPTSCHKAAYQILVFKKQRGSNLDNSGNSIQIIIIFKRYE